ncbi:MAG: hypothetical protein JNK85_15120 [Verrucomicrobiales bacterium]|nr:hypothetical protein [Verrucomicrobiales bacterium]
MKSWHETIVLTRPVRDVVLRRSFGPDDGPSAQDWDTELKAAYERGRADGETQLGQQLVQQRAEVKQLLEGVVVSLRKAVPQVARETEQHLVALALEIAQKLVGEIPVSVDLVEGVVRDALSQVEGATEFHVRLHPADLELLRKMESALLSTGGDAGSVHFHASTEVTRGGCLVQTRFGVIDARRETKVDLLKRTLLG